MGAEQNLQMVRCRVSGIKGLHAGEDDAFSVRLDVAPGRRRVRQPIDTPHDDERKLSS